MGFWSYWGEVVRVAFRHSFSATQNILFAAFIVAGVASKAVPGLADVTAAVSGWQVAALVMGAIFAVRLALAPYWRHRDIERELRKARRNLTLATEAPASKLRLAIAPGVNLYWDQKPPKNESRKGLLSPIMLGFDIDVTNSSDEPLMDCQMWARCGPMKPKGLAGVTMSNWEPASAPFQLRPRETLPLPLFGTAMEAADSYIERWMFYRDEGTWKKAVNAPLLQGDHVFEVEVRSMSTLPATLKLLARERLGPAPLD